MKAAPEFPTETLTVIDWPDGPEDVHDVRSRYVERFWLGVLGPSATWILRHVADELEASPSGFVMKLDETAQALGVGGTGRNSPFMRALGRLVQFEMATLESTDILAVKRRIPNLSRRHVLRLPEHLQSKHQFALARQRLTPVS